MVDFRPPHGVPPRLLVVVAVAAGALVFDQPIERAAFYRSRVRRVWTLHAPRVAVVTLATVAAFVLGTLGAWYETVVLLGDLSAGAMAGWRAEPGARGDEAPPATLCCR